MTRLLTNLGAFLLTGAILAAPMWQFTPPPAASYTDVCPDGTPMWANGPESNQPPVVTFGDNQIALPTYGLFARCGQINGVLHAIVRGWVDPGEALLINASTRTIRSLGGVYGTYPVIIGVDRWAVQNTRDTYLFFDGSGPERVVRIPDQYQGTSQGMLEFGPDGLPVWTDSTHASPVFYGGVRFITPRRYDDCIVGQDGSGTDRILVYRQRTQQLFVVHSGQSPLAPSVGRGCVAAVSYPGRFVRPEEFAVYVPTLTPGPNPPPPPVLEPPGDETPQPDVPNRGEVVSAQWSLQPADGTPEGNLGFIRRVVRELRKESPRWGLNWKRGNVGDPSRDVIGWRVGPTDTDSIIIDIIRASDDPNDPGFGPVWGQYTKEEAGDVRWFWDEPTGGDEPVPPTPPVTPPVPPVTDTLEARLSSMERRLGELQESVAELLRSLAALNAELILQINRLCSERRVLLSNRFLGPVEGRLIECR